MSGFPAKVRQAIQDRSEGLCEGCGERPASEIHHRKYRSRGGTHTIENALHLCGFGNTPAGCHGIAHSGEGGELGWSVSSWDDPLYKPVLYRGVLRWLTRDGHAVDVEPEPNF